MISHSTKVVVKPLSRKEIGGKRKLKIILSKEMTISHSTKVVLKLLSRKEIGTSYRGRKLEGEEEIKKFIERNDDFTFN
jgi:hypothetical protein